VPAVPGEGLRYKLRVEQGRVYNADAIEKSVEEATIEVARMGYPFATVRPRGERNIAARLVDITFVVEEGQRVYVERINIKGNTRTRDYVIRREFDIVEGDPYNRALVDRAERRVKNLGYFKTVKITTEPGSAPDRIIVNCDVEEQSTGEFSFAGGYSTADGIIGEVSIGERNLMGTGDIAKASLQYGQRARGFDLSFVEPYLMGQRLALGTDIFFHQTTSSLYLSYLSKTYGGDIKLGIPIAENISAQARWTGYVQQITLPSVSANCNNTNPDFLSTFPTPDKVNTSPALTPPTGSTQVDCFADGEASIAVQKELAQGAVFVSAPGYTLAYNTLDNNKSPTNGLIVELKQDMAGAGGDVRNLKTTLDTRLYNEIFPDIVGMIRLQGGYATGWGGQDLRMLDHFQAGPNMVRGFAPAGFGPRDITQFGICAQSGGANPGVPCTNSQADALGGSIYWASSLEFQTPVPFAPKDFGMKLAWFADAGQLLDYRGPTSFVSPAVPAELQHLVNSGNGNIRSSVGMGLLWDSPFGPLRFDLAYALTKEPFDHTQIFRFGGGTRF
jgi:outer membrane protein insertion porin family